MTADITPKVAPNEVAPSIADVSYRSYDGELRNRSARWWTITLATLRTGVKKLGYWIPGALILLVYLISGMVFYFTRNARAQFGAEEPANQYAIVLNQGLSGTGLLLFIAALTVGAGSIAADNKANALLVYLSKPITRLDYLVGKWMGVFLLLAGLSVVPALLMYLFFLVAYSGDGFLKDNPTLILRVLAATIFPAALHTSLVMGFSALSKSPRLAGSLYAAFYFVSLIISVTASQLMLSRDTVREMKETTKLTVKVSGDGVTTDKNGANTALVANLSVSGIGSGLAQHLYDVTPQQIAQCSGGRRRNRRRREAAEEGAPVPPSIPAQRPPLV
ncbi:MAG: ABC transporter permease subunit, partial [Akkermansiaceae bacterium]|nr:ABC transporter permease subunit [Armatimonadota bacterium]